MQLSEPLVKFSRSSAVSPGGHSRVLQELSDWPELLYLVKSREIRQGNQGPALRSKLVAPKKRPKVKQAKTSKFPEELENPLPFPKHRSVCQAQGSAVQRGTLQTQAPGGVTIR